MFLALILALSVALGGTHSYALAHDHSDERTLLSSSQPIDNNAASEVDGGGFLNGEKAHSHLTMGSISDAPTSDGHLRKRGLLLLSRTDLALPSHKTPPPLEPPAR